MSQNAPLHYNESRLYCNIWKFVEKTVSRVCGYNELKIAEKSWDFQKALASHPCEK